MTDDTLKIIATNRHALHDYELSHRFEAGIMLAGSEVKVLRQGKCTLTGAHVRVVAGEAWLMNVQIPEYSFAHQFNHAIGRGRKLLLHKREVARIERGLRERGTSCVVLRLYFKGSYVKAEIGLGRGRKQHDKRQVLRLRDMDRDVARDSTGRDGAGRGTLGRNGRGGGP
mgnify:FL=1